MARPKTDDPPHPWHDHDVDDLLHKPHGTNPYPRYGHDADDPPHPHPWHDPPHAKEETLTQQRKNWEEREKIWEEKKKNLRREKVLREEKRVEKMRDGWTEMKEKEEKK